MANGILGSEQLATNTYTLVYTVPADTFAVVSVNFTNKDSDSANIRLAIAKPTESLPQGDDYLEYDTEILPNGALERTGIVLEAGRKVFARSTAVDGSGTGVELTAVQVFGIETATS